jgi:NADPH2:quinone reductase
MKAILFDEIGLPLDVLRVADVPVPDIKEDEVLVKMLGASISPGDFLFIRGLYPKPHKPRFPAQVAGNHGVGVIEGVGRTVALQRGTLVALDCDGAWAEYVSIPASWVIPLPVGYPIEKAAQFFNAITAWDLLDDVRVPPGQWLAITAGNSTVASMVLQFASRGGVNVVSLVRKAHPEWDLKALGANEVIDLSALEGDIDERVMDLTGGQGVAGIVDCVGGAALGDLIRSAAFGGQAIIYGGMSSETFQLHNFDMLLKNLVLRVHGYRYFFSPPKAEDSAILKKIAEVTARPDFRVPLGGFHPLEDFRTAIQEGTENPERGKRFFRM